jgi:FkbM family methyltransferase
MPVQQALAQHVKTGDVFLDIGANIGFFTVIAAKLVGEGGRVFAFEPVPKNAASLRRNLALNDFRQVRVFEAAISDHNGKGELRLSEWIGGAALSTAAPPPDQTGTLAVDLVTIDELVARNEITAPDFVKIDVEGAEMEVLQGMATTIQACKPTILFEIDDGNVEAFNQKATACETFLRAYGYQITRLEDSYPGGEWLVGHYLAQPV